MGGLENAAHYNLLSNECIFNTFENQPHASAIFLD
jgi:hypothetical protein